ncbi:class I adenylate-forming enzyme family protein [Gemmatimonadota bacterium]
MANWLNMGEILRVNAGKYRGKMCLKDAGRSFTFEEIDSRVNRLAQGLIDLGLEKGDRVAVFLDNSVEICEVYFAAARIGIVVAPINFRLDPETVRYITVDCGARALIAHDEWVPLFEQMKNDLPAVEHYLVVGQECEGWIGYDRILVDYPDDEPDRIVLPSDPWIQPYTSGTTGRPKGIVRSHESYVAFYLINAADFGFTSQDICLNVMPLCHVNSTFFTFTISYIGGGVVIHPARSFDPLEVLDVIEREGITFISLIPTHYNIILNAPRQKASKYDVSSVRKLLCSSAPVFAECKQAIMEFFPGVDLYEAYGSTEAGIVTTLMPWDQMNHLGSIGRESAGTDTIRLLDETGIEVPVGEVGEIYSRSPMMFTEYHGMPERTTDSFRGEYFSAGDMGRMDEDGYYHIVDRKDNLIITGGEHVYPSEVEAAVSSHPAVFESAVIGLPHKKWGEAVTVIVVLKEGEAITGDEIMSHCADRLASFMKPKGVRFISMEEMPRTGSGKIIHRVLRERFAAESSD